MDKQNQLNKLKEQIENLTESPLYKLRIKNKTQAVAGEGNADASIFFIGEAPGKNEALTGKPFVGRSGTLLNELLESVSLQREDIYITNIVKDRPPENRDPTSIEIEIYAPFLDKQVEIIKPKVVVTLGRFSMEYIMKRYGLEHELAPISIVHGQIFKTNYENNELLILPLYHPAAAIYNQHLKKTLFEDFKILKTLI